MRISLASNYSMTEALRLFELQRYPEQHLYGLRALESADHVVTPLPFEAGSRLSRLSAFLRGRLGDLPLEHELLKSDGEVLFVAAEDPAAGLALLRRARVLRRPVVAIYHNPPRQDALSRLVAKAYDVAFALSTLAFEGLDRVRPADTFLLSWGPQLDFPSYGAVATSEFAISTGKTARDIDLLAAAAEKAQVPVWVSCRPEWTTTVREVTRRPFDSVLEYPTVLADMARASVVAIPLTRDDRLLGLTELNDALALAKPVVMTRCAHVDVPIEDIGCGLTVELGDLEGWAHALKALHNDRAMAEEMGSAGRRWAERHWNTTICGEQIAHGIGQLGPSR